jgi:uncharacterized membrane protein
MQYAVPLVLLALTILAFFALARGGYAEFGVAQVVLRVVVALPLVASGVLLHFFRTSVTASVIPPAFPARPLLVVLTGLLEIEGAIGLFVPRFRHSAALCIAILMVCVFPANIYAAGQVVDGIRFPSVPVRLAMQVVYIVLVLMAGFGLPRPDKGR